MKIEYVVHQRIPLREWKGKWQNRRKYGEITYRKILTSTTYRQFLKHKNKITTQFKDGQKTWIDMSPELTNTSPIST